MCPSHLKKGRALEPGGAGGCGTITGCQAGTTGAGGWDRGGFGRGLVGWASLVFAGGWVGRGGCVEVGGTWRYVGMTWIWTDPMQTVWSEEREHGKKVGKTETPLGEKEIPLGKKAQSWRKVSFVGEKKYIVPNIHLRMSWDGSSSRNCHFSHLI